MSDSIELSDVIDKFNIQYSGILSDFISDLKSECDKEGLPLLNNTNESTTYDFITFILESINLNALYK